MPLAKGRVREESGAGSGRSISEQLDRLQSGDADARRAAAIALEDAAEVVEQLAERLAEESDPSVMQALSIPLLKHGGEEVARILSQMVRSDEADRRTVAIDILRQMPVEHLSVLELMLEDGDPDVRLLTVNILQHLSRPDLEALLAGRLAGEDDVNVAGALVEALFEVATSDSIDALESAASRFPEQDFLVFAVRAVKDRLGR